MTKIYMAGKMPLWSIVSSRLGTIHSTWGMVISTWRKSFYRMWTNGCKWYLLEEIRCNYQGKMGHWRPLYHLTWWLEPAATSHGHFPLPKPGKVPEGHDLHRHVEKVIFLDKIQRQEGEAEKYFREDLFCLANGTFTEEDWKKWCSQDLDTLPLA